MHIPCSQCNELLYIGEKDLKIKNHGLVMALCNPCLEKYNIEIVEINDFLKSCGNCGYRQLEIHIEPCSACNQCDKWEREEYTNDTSDSSC